MPWFPTLEVHAMSFRLALALVVAAALEDPAETALLEPEPAA
jgi:hypothetical protein